MLNDFIASCGHWSSHLNTLEIMVEVPELVIYDYMIPSVYNIKGDTKDVLLHGDVSEL